MLLGSILYRVHRTSYSPLPPEILLYAGPHAGHEVVEVHDDVDSHVEKPTEGGVAASNKPGNKSVLTQLGGRRGGGLGLT